MNPDVIVAEGEFAVVPPAQAPILAWRETSLPENLAVTYFEATLGDYDGGDGVRFTLDYRRTCYRRGPWHLLIEVAHGPGHAKWGCFDFADQPERNFHIEANALSEAEALAAVLLKDREARG